MSMCQVYLEQRCQSHFTKIRGSTRGSRPSTAGGNSRKTILEMWDFASSLHLVCLRCTLAFLHIREYLNRARSFSHCCIISARRLSVEGLVEKLPHASREHNSIHLDQPCLSMSPRQGASPPQGLGAPES